MALVSAGSLYGCDRQSSQPPAPPPPPDVVVSDVTQRDVPIYVEWVGTTDGNINAQIRARVNGYLQSRDYNEGTAVRAGDLMFAIDPRPYQAALDQAKGELGRAEAQLTKTAQDVSRYTPLAAQGAISQQELDNAVQANRSARAAVESARATVEKARLDLDWTQIRAPIDGVAGLSVAQIGDLISESTVLTTVSQIDPIKAAFPISEQEYLRYADRIQLNNGQLKPREGALELILADGRVYPQRGTATVANRQVDIKTGTMMIVGLFPNPNGLIRPGQYAKVRATVETKSAAILVPQLAVQEVQGVKQVAVVGSDNKVSIRTITGNTRVDKSLIVEDGLKPGEKVVVEGLQKVRNGATVNPKPAPAESAK